MKLTFLNENNEINYSAVNSFEDAESVAETLIKSGATSTGVVLLYNKNKFYVGYFVISHNVVEFTPNNEFMNKALEVVTR